MRALKRGGANHEHVRGHDAGHLLDPEEVSYGTTVANTGRLGTYRYVCMYMYACVCLSVRVYVRVCVCLCERMHIIVIYWQITILLVVDLCSSLAYFMMTQLLPGPIASKLRIKILVARQLTTSMHIGHCE